MKELLESIHDKARNAHVPIMKDDGMDLLCAFIEEHTEIRDILECGTAVGYSSMRMASIRWDMTVDTLEVMPAMYAQAVKNIEDAGLSDQIHCYLCDAAEFVTKKQYDLIFIDAAKSQYRRYMEHFWKNSRVGTYFIFDNLNFHGIVDDESLSGNRSTIQMVHKIKKFREHLLNDTRLETAYYGDRGDGIAIAKKVKEI